MILVTGAASGIGAALVARLRAAGRRSVGLDLRASDADLSLSCDLADADARAAAVAAIDAPLDGIAHVAGLPGTHAPGWVLAVNLFAIVDLTRRLEARFAPGAAIVAVSSIAAQRCDWPEPALAALIAGEGVPDDLSGAAAYELSKRALSLWVTMEAARLAPRGVRVNAVSPGPVETPILADFERSMGPARLAAAARLAGRHATADEIAAPVAWLLSGEAAWVNGVDLRVDGGFHAIRAARALAVK